MTTLYEHYEELTRQEKAYLSSNPHHAMILKDSRELAFAETIRIFRRNRQNDKSDAFRHCFWSAILARDLGFHNATRFTTAHESSPKNRLEEKRMDLHNNRIGLGIGLLTGTNASLSARCMTALRTGKLRVLSE
ncbi:hypothetical protein [Massilia sp. H6]|uniref:DUF6973 domain-containing protein n=1 Tax=Massilia sp. H6 TaxID=2970464 RepID=UPI002169A0A4|nr:hypothetical protein [Massilia sp. H6]UVW27588.1 hypothetical protein NRS07_13655 [Massilia sp. H6]